MLSYRQKTTWPYVVAVALAAWLVITIPSELWYRFTKHSNPGYHFRLAVVSFLHKTAQSEASPASQHESTHDASSSARHATRRNPSIRVPEHGRDRAHRPDRIQAHLSSERRLATTPVKISASSLPVGTTANGTELGAASLDRKPMEASSEPKVSAAEPVPTPIIAVATSETSGPLAVAPLTPVSRQETSHSTTIQVPSSAEPPTLPSDGELDDSLSEGIKSEQAVVHSSVWPRAKSLLHQLDSLRNRPLPDRLKEWIDDVSALLESLAQVRAHDDGQVPVVLAELESLAQSEFIERPPVRDGEIAAEIRRVGHALARRIAISRACYAAARSQPSRARVLPDVGTLAQQTHRLRTWLGQTPATKPWIGYLSLDRLMEVTDPTRQAKPAIVHQAARETLARIESESLSDAQRNFLADPKFQPLRDELRRWALRPVDLSRFLASVEEFEQTRQADSARDLVETMRDFRWSAVPDQAVLSDEMDFHYRNANLRIAVNESLLNAILPVVQPVDEGVRDQVLGASVRGRNSTWTRLGIRLIPDAQHIRLRLVAQGQTQSRTVSQKGPVRVFSQGDSTFHADKEVLISPQHIQTFDASADATGGARMTDIRTDYDQVPLLGWMLRQMAINEQAENRGPLRAHVRNRVTSSAKFRLNDAVASRLNDIEQKMASRLVEPLRRMDLNLKAVEMRSTSDQVILRCRLAGSHQLAAFTPRPRAIPGSLLELQLHQSAINNLLQQLELSGQRFDLTELVTRLYHRFGWEYEHVRDDIPENVTVRLAGHQPIAVTFDDDRVQVAIDIAELRTPKRKWRNFEVRARYRADITGMQVDLQREGGIELASKSIGFRDQIALRGIFTKVMSQNPRLNVLRGRFQQDPRLASLEVTQFVSRDGWIGISLASRSRDRIAQEGEGRRR